MSIKKPADKIMCFQFYMYCIAFLGNQYSVGLPPNQISG